MADVELLPLPAIERWNVTGDYAFPTATDPEGHAVDYDAHVDAMQSYARANVEHHAAPLQAENERLREEVERLTFDMSCLQQQYDERTAYMIVHRGAALACSDSVRAAYSDEHERAERLAEALRWAERHCPCGARPESPDTHPHLPGCLVGAALAQEDRNG